MFAISTVYYARKGYRLDSAQKFDKVALGVDPILLLATGIIGSFILSGTFGGVNSLHNPLGWGLVGVSGLIFGVDGLAFGFRKRCKNEDKLSELPFEIYSEIASYLDKKEVLSLKQINKKSQSIIAKNDKQNALRGISWFKLDIAAVEKYHPWGKLEKTGKHSCHIKLNNANTSIERMIVDRHCFSRSELDGSYYIPISIKCTEKGLFARFEFGIYWVEESGFRKDESGEVLKDWGNGLTDSEQMRIKSLFYDIFSEVK